MLDIGHLVGPEDAGSMTLAYWESRALGAGKWFVWDLKKLTSTDVKSYTAFILNQYYLCSLYVNEIMLSLVNSKSCTLTELTKA